MLLLIVFDFSIRKGFTKAVLPCFNQFFFVSNMTERKKIENEVEILITAKAVN